MFDTTKLDGAPRKLMNVDRLKSLGWKSTVTLEIGVASSYQWFIDNYASFISALIQF